MTTEMVERVAKAICEAYGHYPDERVASSGKEAWEYKVREARAAIRALMEPTEEMVSKGSDGSSQYAADLAKHTWQAMLTAALGEDQFGRPIRQHR